MPRESGVAGRDPGEGGGRRTDLADPLHAGEQQLRHRQPLHVQCLGVRSDRIVAHGNQCVGQAAAVTTADRRTVAGRAVPFGGGVPGAEHRMVDDARHRAAVDDQAKRDAPQRCAVDEVDGPVDRIEHPARAVRRSALLFAEYADLRCLLLEKRTDLALHREVHLGGHVPIALGGQDPRCSRVGHHPTSIDGSFGDLQQFGDIHRSEPTPDHATSAPAVPPSGRHLAPSDPVRPCRVTWRVAATRPSPRRRHPPRPLPPPRPGRS